MYDIVTDILYMYNLHVVNEFKCLIFQKKYEVK